MPIPLDRVAIYLSNSVNILKGYQKELGIGANPKRIHEIQRDTKLIHKIIREMLNPYTIMLEEIVPEETLRELGLID